MRCVPPTNGLTQVGAVTKEVQSQHLMPAVITWKARSIFGYCWPLWLLFFCSVAKNLFFALFLLDFSLEWNCHIFARCSQCVCVFLSSSSLPRFLICLCLGSSARFSVCIFRFKTFMFCCSCRLVGRCVGLLLDCVLRRVYFFIVCFCFSNLEHSLPVELRFSHLFFFFLAV